jgi:putative ABC transport system permease protein
VPSIVVLLSKEFTRLVLIAFFLAAPVAYVVMNGWLDGFAYRAEISWWMYAAAALSALAVAWLTVGYQSVKAALADPVDSLRYE